MMRKGLFPLLVAPGCAPPDLEGAIGAPGLSIEVVLPVRDLLNPVLALDAEGHLATTLGVDVDGADWVFVDPNHPVDVSGELSQGHWHYQIPDGGKERMSFGPTVAYDSAAVGDTWLPGDTFTMLVSLRDLTHQPIEVNSEPVTAFAEWTIIPAEEPD